MTLFVFLDLQQLHKGLQRPAFVSLDSEFVYWRRIICCISRAIYKYTMSHTSVTNMNSMKTNKSVTVEDDKICICNRPHTIIICNSCGFWARGRVRAHCPQHPTVVFLHDYSQCPRCKGYDDMLTEI